VTRRHYDVIVLGRSPGALAAAVLLARRDRRVLLLGQGGRPATYRFEGRPLRRRSFTFLAATSPAFRRLLHELAQAQTFRRRLVAQDPMFGVLGPGFRLDVPPDSALFAAEIEREFPEVRQLVDELYAGIASANANAEAAFERDLVWPPGTLWERLETGRAASELPRPEPDAESLLARFPARHAFREVALAPALFANDLGAAHAAMPAFTFARLHGAWTRGLYALAGGEDELESFLVDRLLAHGGEARLDARAESLVVRRGAVVGVVEDGLEHPTSADALVTDLAGEQLAELARGEGITRQAERDWPRVSAVGGRFVTSLVVQRRGLPEPLPAESFLLSSSGLGRPRVHLSRIDGLDGSRPDESLLVAETLLPRRGAVSPAEARAVVLQAVEEHLPFLRESLVHVDSPHDGLPLWDFRGGERRDVDRMHLPETAARGEPLRPLLAVEPSGYHGIAGEPLRGPIQGTYLVGPTVLPGLGQEGLFLAALGVARILARRSRQRERLRRDLWDKLESS